MKFMTLLLLALIPASGFSQTVKELAICGALEDFAQADFTKTKDLNEPQADGFIQKYCL